MKQLSISFFIRNSRKNKEGLSPIYCRITIEGSSCSFSTNRRASPDKWNPDDFYVKGNSPEAKDVNDHLSTIRNRIYALHTQLVHAAIDVTPEKLRDEFIGKKKKQKTVDELFQQHNNMMKERIGHDIVYDTYRRYETTHQHVMDYVSDRYQKQDLALTALDYPFIRDFEHYLKTVKELGHNTTLKMVRNLKKVVKMAVENGWLKQHPFSGYSLQWQEADTVFLEEKELKKLENAELANESLREARDVFVFCCYTGLAYVDLEALQKEDVFTDDEGCMWLTPKRSKTKKRSTIFLLPKARNIINKYADHPDCAPNNRLLPVRSNQKYNKALSKLAEKCGLNKRLTSHVARHTCATILLNKGVPIETVSKILGHSSVPMTQHYAKLLNQKVKEDMQKLEKLWSGEQIDSE